MFQFYASKTSSAAPSSASTQSSANVWGNPRFVFPVLGSAPSQPKSGGSSISLATTSATAAAPAKPTFPSTNSFTFGNSAFPTTPPDKNNDHSSAPKAFSFSSNFFQNSSSFGSVSSATNIPFGGSGSSGPKRTGTGAPAPTCPTGFNTFSPPVSTTLGSSTTPNLFTAPGPSFFTSAPPADAANPFAPKPTVETTKLASSPTVETTKLASSPTGINVTPNQTGATWAFNLPSLVNGGSNQNTTVPSGFNVTPVGGSAVHLTTPKAFSFESQPQPPLQQQQQTQTAAPTPATAVVASEPAPLLPSPSLTLGVPSSPAQSDSLPQPQPQPEVVNPISTTPYHSSRTTRLRSSTLSKVTKARKQSPPHPRSLLVAAFSDNANWLKFSTNPKALSFEPSSHATRHGNNHGEQEDLKGGDSCAAEPCVVKCGAGPFPAPSYASEAKASSGSDTPTKRSALAPKLTKSGYYCVPSIPELAAMTQQQMSCVEDFIIGHSDFGVIRFTGPVDLRGLDLDSVVAFEHRAVTVDPACAALSSKQATVTLFDARPPTESCPADRWERALRNACEQDGATFLFYDHSKAHWSFHVNSFA